MAERTIPEYGASIAIEDSTASLYLREKALDAVQEQVIDDLNNALRMLDGRDVLVGTDHEALSELIGLISNANDLAKVAWEISFAKTPPEEEA